MSAGETTGEDLRLVLASGSPRRRRMLRDLGIEVEVRPVDIDETPAPGELPRDLVLRLAEAKAEARAEPGELILAADTIVVIDDEILGKPADPEDAARMLGRLSGRTHEVLTAVALFDPRRSCRVACVESTQVTFTELSEEEIRWYVATEEPLDKAGSYAVQGLGALFVERLEGNYSNVVGLPLPMVYRLLRHFGFQLLPEQQEEP